MYDISIKIENYKCFINETGFDSIKRVNLIIGRNNAGKSSLLDVIEKTVESDYDFNSDVWNKHQPYFIFKSKVTQVAFDGAWNNMDKSLRENLNKESLKKLVDREIKWSRNLDDFRFIECDASLNLSTGSHHNFLYHLLPRIKIPLEKKTFKRLLSERDISPEKDSDSLELKPNGQGLTNIVQRYINRTDLPSKLVKKSMLNALNNIMDTDSNFRDIVCQINDNGYWEIYLEEENKDYVALSKSGSGLKTIVMVLAYLYLLPNISGRRLDEFIFGFEELENNLHPALLRRLNSYLYEMSINNNFIYFLTTHSNVMIDQFSKQEDAQIIHITHINAKSTCSTAKTYIEHSGILDDLDVRASDILQANGIIWVEGPSDRIYLNRWIELWSEGKLKEGTHYQIVFYGGRLLSHLTAGNPTAATGSIAILKANRNSIIMIDSDKRSRNAQINESKKRIKQEFANMDSLCWITKGKEIENYIPAGVVDAFLNQTHSPQVGSYDSFFGYINTLKANEGTKYESKKPLLAEKLLEHMTKENLFVILDLDERMNEVCKTIKEWNSLF